MKKNQKHAMNKKIKTISGYSKLSRAQKIELLALTTEEEEIINNAIVKYNEIGDIINDLSENTITHFPFPYSIAPNFVVNNQSYFLPLVTEESSVVAAISKAAKFWAEHGGFKTKIMGTTKKGQVHFFWKGSVKLLQDKFIDIENFIFKNNARLTERMESRGGGISKIILENRNADIPNYYRLDVDFETIDAMGANFINTCLEEIGSSLKLFVENDADMDENRLDVNMCILSNYTPESRVRVWASCTVDELNAFGKKTGIDDFANKFVLSVKIAKNDLSRAVTHNKGIFNGIDAVLLATANDWRAVEACGHAYASRNGQYTSLSDAYIKGEKFTLIMEFPMAIGTVGGVTNLHPLAKLALKILGKPNAAELMQIIAASGLAANFSAVSALITTGIQQGHMKMHMSNVRRHILAQQKEDNLKKQLLMDASNTTLERHNPLFRK